MSINKQLILGLLWSLSQVVLSCDLVVAKVQWRDALANSVSVLRDGQSYFITKDNRELCSGDQLTVLKQAVPIVIWYYAESDNKEEIVQPVDNYQLKKLEEPCSVWCKAEDKIASLWATLTGETPYEPDVLKPVVSRGTEANKPLFLPLAAGKAKDAPFYLFANQGRVDVFWHNGKPPFEVTLRDDNEKVVPTEQAKDRQWSFEPPVSEVGTQYRLTIKDQQGEYSTKIIFTVPPFPLNQQEDKFKLFATLLQDEKNWRLEIWRQLQALPESSERQNVMSHLTMDNF